MAKINEELKRVVALAASGEYEEALGIVLALLRQDPDSQKALIFRYTLEARLFHRSEQFHDAAQRYYAVLGLEPDNREAKGMIEKYGEQDRQRQNRVAAPRRQPVQGMYRGEPVQKPGPAARTGGVVERNEPRRASDRPTRPHELPPEFSMPGATPPRETVPSAEIKPPVAAMESSMVAQAAHMSALASNSSLPPGTVRTRSKRPGGKSSIPPNDRRQQQRVELAVEVGLRSESNFYTGFSGDISEGGVFIATYNLLPQGSRVEVSFGLPGGHEIVTAAEVRWIFDPIDINEQPGMGVRFLSLTEHQAEAIRQFMELRAPMFFDDE
jgi:uncharacterized protein (TIGR02266 family)